ncbi:zinc protease [beta proteobacterium AAP99]|nr:zinc protease [beta proteobacterium AAP99]
MLRTMLLATALTALAAPLLPLHAQTSAPTPKAASAPATSPVARTPAAALKPVTSVEGINEYRLSNGLQVLLIPDDSKPTVTVNVTYRVGSKHENYGETGMAHLLEHLLFKGTPTNPNVWAEFDKRGFRANGTTWTDRTNYFASFAYNEDNLRWYLSWQADAMVNSYVARKDLDSEMTVVRNEMEMGENNPFRILIERMMSTAYQWHNYGKTTIGARADVENVNIERLQAFYRLYYQPDNATLIVSGKFNPQQVLGWVNQYFGKIPKPKRALPKLYTIDPAQDGERSVTVRRIGGSQVLMAAYHVPAASHPDFAAVSMINLMLGDTPAGRLHKALVDGQLAAQTFAFGFDWAHPTLTLYGAQLAPGQDLEKARSAMLGVLDGIAARPFTEEELNRARTTWLKQWDLSFTDPERVGIALSTAIALGDWRLYFLNRDRVRKTTLADVQRVATSYLLPDNRTIGLYLPTEKPVRAPAPAFVDVPPMVAGYKGDAALAQAEAFDPTPANLQARMQRFELPNGMKVAIIPKGTRGNVVHGSISMDFSDEKAAFGLFEVGAATGFLLDKGTTSKTRQQVQDRFDQLKSQVNFFGSATRAGANFTTTRQNLPEVIALASEVLRTPSFPADALEEWRRISLAGLEQARKDPEGVVENFIARHGNPYKKGDVRYGRTFDEVEAEIRGVKIEDVRAFHQRFYGANNGQVGISGDADVAAVRKALEAGFGSWKSPVTYTRVPNPFVAVPAVRELLRTPDKQNAYMQVELQLPLTDNDADYVPLLVANYLLGGSGNSRLWVRIREKDGLSYGTGSWVQWNNHEPNSTWSAMAIFAPQNRPKVEAAFREEVALALKDGFTATELKQAQEGMLNDRRLSRAQDQAIAGGLTNQLRLGRDFRLTQRIDEQIAKVTLDQVNAALRKYIEPAKFQMVFGGDFKE